jgi:hypothetical protein
MVGGVAQPAGASGPAPSALSPTRRAPAPSVKWDRYDDHHKAVGAAQQTTVAFDAFIDRPPIVGGPFAQDDREGTAPERRPARRSSGARREGRLEVRQCPNWKRDGLFAWRAWWAWCAGMRWPCLIGRGVS